MHRKTGRCARAFDDDDDDNGVYPLDPSSWWWCPGYVGTFVRGGMIGSSETNAPSRVMSCSGPCSCFGRTGGPRHQSTGPASTSGGKKVPTHLRSTNPAPFHFEALRQARGCSGSGSGGLRGCSFLAFPLGPDFRHLRPSLRIWRNTYQQHSRTKPFFLI